MSNTPQMKITLTPAMAFALQVLSERSGLPEATEARRLLNAALKATISTEEVRQRIERSPHEADRWHLSRTPRYRRNGDGPAPDGPDQAEDGP